VPEPLSEELMAILVELKIPHTMGKLQKKLYLHPCWCS